MPNNITPSDPIINYSEIVEHISNEIHFVWSEMARDGSDEVKEIIKSIKQINVTDEQLYRKQEKDNKLSKGAVYLVIRFGSGAMNYASSVTPITIQGLGVANQVKPVQLLLGTFSSYWTTKNLSQGLENEKGDQLQLWNSPEVISNFNILDTDFRNLYRVTGNVVTGPSAIRVGTLTYYYGDNYSQSEEINVMAFKDIYHGSPDPEAFGHTGNFVNSELNFSTYVFSISTYLLNSQLGRDMLAIRGFRYRPDDIYTLRAGKSSVFKPSKKVKIKIKFNNDFTNEKGYELINGNRVPETPNSNDAVKGDDFYEYYLVIDSQISQELGAIPTLTITFAR